MKKLIESNQVITSPDTGQEGDEEEAILEERRPSTNTVSVSATAL